jgi:hypothetical protein
MRSHVTHEHCVTACLVRMAELLVQRFGLQTEGILLREGDALEVVSIFKVRTQSVCWSERLTVCCVGYRYRQTTCWLQCPFVGASNQTCACALVRLVTMRAQWYASLPVRIFQPLHTKLEKAVCVCVC